MKTRDNPAIAVRGGMVFVDGVKVGRVAQRGGEACIEFLDRNRQRSAERGSREVCVPVEQLAQAVRDHVKGD